MFGGVQGGEAMALKGLQRPGRRGGPDWNKMVTTREVDERLVFQDQVLGKEVQWG
jgi:hypothetical protein